MNEIKELQDLCRGFAARRNWFQFHTPKNLAMAIAGEAGELAAEFQWLTAEESLATAMKKEKLHDVQMEVADVAIYLLRLCDEMDFDLASAVKAKLEINEMRFPTS